MRILWLDSSTTPWKEADGWDYLNEYQLEIVRVANAEAARAELPNIAIAVFNADVTGALDLLCDIKTNRRFEKIPVILVSEKWSKKDFKLHSTSPFAAQNYSQLPMPVIGFIDVVAKLTNSSRVELLRKDMGLQKVMDPSSMLLSEAEGEKAYPDSEVTPSGIIPPLPKGRKAPWRKGEPQIPEDDSGPGTPPPMQTNSADVDVLQRYLVIREQELQRAVRDKKNLQELYDNLSRNAEDLRKQLRELEHMKQEADGKIERFEKKYSEQEHFLMEQKEKAEFERESLLDRVKTLEKDLDDSKERYSGLKDRVRKDIRKIQMRERELENRLELLKKDSETLILERDKQVLELKRKIDALEFDLDLIQDRKVQAENNANKYVDKLSRVARTLQVAFGMIEDVAEDAVEEDIPRAVIMGGAATPPPKPDVAVTELNTQEIEAAEAPTRVFNKEIDSGAEQLLAGVIEEGSPEDAATSNEDDIDKALGS